MIDYDENTLTIEVKLTKADIEQLDEPMSQERFEAICDFISKSLIPTEIVELVGDYILDGFEECESEL